MVTGDRELGPARAILTPVRSGGYYLRNLSVLQGARGAGAGSALLAQLAAEADAEGAELHTHAAAHLHGFYARQGFAHVGDDDFGPRLRRAAR